MTKDENEILIEFRSVVADILRKKMAEYLEVTKKNQHELNKAYNTGIVDGLTIVIDILEPKESVSIGVNDE